MIHVIYSESMDYNESPHAIRFGNVLLIEYDPNCFITRDRISMSYDQASSQYEHHLISNLIKWDELNKKRRVTL